MAGGMFYFFAQSMPQPVYAQNTSNGSGMETAVKKASVQFDLKYPDSIKADNKFTVSFSVYNPSSRTIHDAAIKLGDLSLFEVESDFNIDSDMLNLGDIPPGEISGYLQLKAPSEPTVLEDVLTLTSRDIDAVSKTIKINIQGDSQQYNKNNKKKNTNAKKWKKQGEDDD